MKNRQLMGHQRLSMEGKLVYRTSLRKRGWENFIHRRGKLRYTHSPWWGRDCRQILKQECEDSVIWEMKAHILRECNKVCIPLLIWEIVSCILVEGWKPQTQCFRYSSFSLQTLPSLVKKQVKKSSWKEDFFFSILSFRVQQAGPHCQGPILRERGEQSWTSARDQGQTQPGIRQACPQRWGGSKVKPGSQSAAQGLEMGKEIRW